MLSVVQIIVGVWIKAAGSLAILYSDLNKKRAEEAKADSAAAEAEAIAESQALPAAPM